MFDFNSSMLHVIQEIRLLVPVLAHVDPKHLQIGASTTRTSRRAGLLAYVVPLKFRYGSPVERRVRGRRVFHWAMLPQYRDGWEQLYNIYFLLPRFLNLSFQEKLETIVHELYHINPQFDGSLRTFKGRSRLHGNHKEYDECVRGMTRRFLDSNPSLEGFDFLHLNHGHLVRKHSDVFAYHPVEPRPKLLCVEPLRPITESKSAEIGPDSSRAPEDHAHSVRD